MKMKSLFIQLKNNIKSIFSVRETETILDSDDTIDITQEEFDKIVESMGDPDDHRPDGEWASKRVRAFLKKEEERGPIPTLEI